MAIEYRFNLGDDIELLYSIELDREFDPEQGNGARAWTRLANNQCSNCPLKNEEHKHCPAALDLYPVIEDFKGLPAFKKSTVKVITPEREYVKLVGLEEGLRALMGVIMATSACPHMSVLKPMAIQHLPFANNQEFVMRAVSLYLTRQYFNQRDGLTPDWELKGLVKVFQQLQLVNQAFWHRIHDECAGDSNLKAFLNFFSMASSVSYSLETQLQKIRPLIMGREGL